jgi:type VI secretion system protein ImpH
VSASPSPPRPLPLDFEAALRQSPEALDFFQALRRLECRHRDRPRLGEALRPSDEPLRLGQAASLGFAVGALSSYGPGLKGGPPRLEVNFLGLMGPNGPLPLHLTEYVRDRLRNGGDPTLARFLDVFHHRMLTLFYRAWANSQPAVSRDRPESDRFFGYFGSLVGIGAPVERGRDEFDDRARLYYSGRLAAQRRNAEGLRAIIGDHFGMPAAIEEFAGEWVTLPEGERWPLGGGPSGPRLGLGTILGKRAWQRQTKFRVVLGPLDQRQFQSMLPGQANQRRLVAVVRSYVGEELSWDLRLILDQGTDQPLRLGTARLGWDAWLGRRPRGREDVILNPAARAA